MQYTIRKIIDCADDDKRKIAFNDVDNVGKITGDLKKKKRISYTQQYECCYMYLHPFVGAGETVAHEPSHRRHHHHNHQQLPAVPHCLFSIIFRSPGARVYTVVSLMTDNIRAFRRHVI